MTSADDFLLTGLRTLGPKPSDAAKQSEKKRYSERVSACVAQAFAAELRERGLDRARPAPPGKIDVSGAERRMAGGIGAKKVDVTFATEESGLILAFSIKSVNFVDGASKNFQKNLTNRRGDMLFLRSSHPPPPLSLLSAGWLLFFSTKAPHMMAANPGSRRS